MGFGNNIATARSARDEVAARPAKILDLLSQTNHKAAQNAHLVEVHKVETAFNQCIANNDIYKAMYGANAQLDDCAKTCTNFNGNVDMYNNANGFAGEMAFAHAECN
jgi:hypothetical protein